MAASMWRMNGLWRRMAGVLVLAALLLNGEVKCQETDITPAASPAGTTAASNTSVDDAADSAPPAADGEKSDNPNFVVTNMTLTLETVDDGGVTSSNDTSTVEESIQAVKPGSTQNQAKSSGSSSVFVGILVTGLLAALALTVGYFKCQRKTDTKGVRLAEEAYPLDQDNQGNTLVSVAPLNPPPETQEKPNVNGETPEADKTQPPPPTNGHSTAKAADTEL